MSHVIQKLAALNDLEQGISVNVGTVEGGERPNVVAPECKIEVDVRVPRTADVRPLEEAIRQLKPNLPIVVLDIQGGINRPPLERTPRNQELWRLAQEVGRELGLELEQSEAGGGSDGNFTSEFAATLDGLGAVGDGAHARHEFIYIDKLAERATLLAGIMARP
jgi:glutamate carboxypeptidase